MAAFCFSIDSILAAKDCCNITGGIGIIIDASSFELMFAWFTAPFAIALNNFFMEGILNIQETNRDSNFSAAPHTTVRHGRDDAECILTLL